MSSVCSIDVMTPERFRRLKQALARRQHDLTVIADGVHKDHNVSAIIRTCDAVGIARLHVVSAEGFRRHHMIAGGSRRWVNVDVHATAEAAYATVRENGLRIVAAHAGADAIDFRDYDYTAPTAIVLGSELTGTTPYAIERADQTVAIPMHGLVESLNVSVAAAIILMEAERQRTAADLYSRPPSDLREFEHKLFEWTYPDIALRCRELDRAYPALDDEGQLTANPFD